MKIIKRDGSEQIFDKHKIAIAISKANKECLNQIPDSVIDEMASDIEDECIALHRAPSVEEVQEMVEDKLITRCAGYEDSPEIAKRYIRYRYMHNIDRDQERLDKKILSLINNENEELKQENSNKNPVINSVQRDYIAGEVSRDMTNRLFLPEHIRNAHDEGLIHFHDQDYFIQRMFNCCLINMDDMLQNGTVISETMIETPHSFSTACNIATQIVAQVASNQFGGNSFTLTHLAPFVDASRRKIRKEAINDLEGISYTNDQLEHVVHSRLLKEIEKGVQTIQYQVLSLLTSNGKPSVWPL